MVASLGGSEQNYQQDTHTTKARVVERNKDKLGRMNKTGEKKFRLYWMGFIPQIIGKKKRWVKYKNLVKQALCTSK